MAVIYTVLGITPLDALPNGPKHDTRSNGPKDGIAAPWQILDTDLFRRFPLIPKRFCVRPLGLASLSNYLSNHMWIIENGVQMRPG